MLKEILLNDLSCGHFFFLTPPQYLLFYPFLFFICVLCLKVRRGWLCWKWLPAFWLFMDSNRRHLKRTMKLLIFVMGHLLNCFLQQSHNSIYVISFYFQQQLIMYSWLLVFIFWSPMTILNSPLQTFASKVIEM